MPSPVELLPLAATALPDGEASRYVAGAYIVFLVLLVVYVAIMAAKVQRIERELRELAGFAESRRQGELAEEPVAPGGGEESSVSGSLAPDGSGGGGAR